MKKFQFVLLIDDDKIINFINEKTIKLSNIAEQVMAFQKAEDALKFIEEGCQTMCKDVSSVLIFLDLNMPIMDGWDFLDALKNYTDFPAEKCRVIILSSSIDPKDKQKRKEYSLVTDFISKPLTVKHLEEIRDKVLAMIPAE